MRLIDFLDRGGQIAKGHDCLIDGDLRLRFDEVIGLSNRVARALVRDGVQPGEAAAILAPNSAAGLVCLFGLLRADAVLVPLNPRNAISDNVHHARSGKAKVIFFHSSLVEDVKAIAKEVTDLRLFVVIDKKIEGYPELQEWLGDCSSAPVVPATPSDPEATWRYSMTGGTTGRPKLVMQPHRAAEALIITLMAVTPYETPPVYLLAAPMTHAGGMFSFAYMGMGGAIVVLPKADPKLMFDAIERHRVTTLFVPPTLLYMMLAEPGVRSRDFSSLRHFITGAAPLSRDKLVEAMDVFGPVMAQLFGQTEASGVVTYMSPQEYERARTTPELADRLLSCGRPTPLAQVAIMDDAGKLLREGEVGEIVVRGPLLMKGYLDAPEETAAARTFGWHHTGDVGKFDSEGFLTIVDRKRDLIISGGFNVFPSEVEQVLWAHPAVQDCAVIGVPDSHWGEAVKAVVELKGDCSTTPEELVGWCRTRLGGVKTPKSIEIWQSLPRSPNGKVLRREVRKVFWTATERQI